MARRAAACNSLDVVDLLARQAGLAERMEVNTPMPTLMREYLGDHITPSNALGSPVRPCAAAARDAPRPLSVMENRDARNVNSFGSRRNGGPASLRGRHQRLFNQTTSGDRLALPKYSIAEHVPGCGRRLARSFRAAQIVPEQSGGGQDRFPARYEPLKAAGDEAQSFWFGARDPQIGISTSGYSFCRSTAPAIAAAGRERLNWL